MARQQKEWREDEVTRWDGAGHLKRMACQIAAQMPDDFNEAMLVLGYTRDILCNLGRAWAEERGTARMSGDVIPFSRTFPTYQEASSAACREGRCDPPHRSSPEKPPS